MEIIVKGISGKRKDVEKVLATVIFQDGGMGLWQRSCKVNVWIERDDSMPISDLENLAVQTARDFLLQTQSALRA